MVSWKNITRDKVLSAGSLFEQQSQEVHYLNQEVWVMERRYQSWPPRATDMLFPAWELRETSWNIPNCLTQHPSIFGWGRREVLIPQHFQPTLYRGGKKPSGRGLPVLAVGCHLQELERGMSGSYKQSQHCYSQWRLCEGWHFRFLKQCTVNWSRKIAWVRREKRELGEGDSKNPRQLPFTSSLLFKWGDITFILESLYL